MATYTAAQIDAMTGVDIRRELVGMSVPKTEYRGKRVPELKEYFKNKLGVATPTPPGVGGGNNNTTTGSNSATAATSAAGGRSGGMPPATNSATAATSAMGGGGGGMPPAIQQVVHPDVITALMNCRMSKKQADLFAVNQGLHTLADLAEWEPNDVSEAVDRYNGMMKGTHDADRISSTVTIKRIEALVYITRIFHQCGTTFTLDQWAYDHQIKSAMTSLEQCRTKEKNQSDATPIKDTVKVDDISSDKAFEAFEAILVNLRKRPSAAALGADVSYIARPANAVTPKNPTLDQRLYHGLPFSGSAYIRDNGDVYDAIEEWAQGTKIYDHIKIFKKDRNGRGALLALKAVFLGESSVDSILVTALDLIGEGSKGLAYNGELTGNMDFPNYFGALGSNFALVEEHSGDTYSESTKVLRLIKGFKGDPLQQQIITIACEKVKDDHKYLNDFQAAGSYLQKKIRQVYAAQIANKGKNNQSVNETNTGQLKDDKSYGDYHGGGYGRGRGGPGRGRGGGRYGRGGGRGGRGRGGGRGYGTVNHQLYNGQTVHKEINGVDVSDVDKSFSSEVFHGAVRTYVMNRRKVIHPEQYGQYNNNRNGGVDVKQLAMSVAEVLSKRDAEGDDNPSETKKSKGGETKNGFQKMFQKRED